LIILGSVPTSALNSAVGASALKKDSHDLRKKAALARRAASVVTEGGRSADRYLLEFATRLEESAEDQEREALIKGPKDKTR
jgi:hypothetical protein